MARITVAGIRDKILSKFSRSTQLETPEVNQDNVISGDREPAIAHLKRASFLKILLISLKKQNVSENDDLLAEIDQKLESSHLSRIPGFFHQFLKKIKPEDIEKINQNLDKMNRGAIQKIWPKIQALANMIRDPKAAWNVKALAIATLIYLVSPFDAVPDLIPFAGLADDAALIVAVVSTIAGELEKYLVKQAENKADIEIRKYNKIVKITLIGSIAAAALTIAVKLILNQL